VCRTHGRARAGCGRTGIVCIAPIDTRPNDGARSRSYTHTNTRKVITALQWKTLARVTRVACLAGARWRARERYSIGRPTRFADRTIVSHVACARRRTRIGAATCAASESGSKNEHRLASHVLTIGTSTFMRSARGKMNDSRYTIFASEGPKLSIIRKPGAMIVSDAVVLLTYQV